MAKKRRFDFTKKNKRSGKVENVGYLDLEQDEEQSRRGRHQGVQGCTHIRHNRRK